MIITVLPSLTVHFFIDSFGNVLFAAQKQDSGNKTNMYL